MTILEWQALMKELLDGVQRELGSRISRKAKDALDAFRKRLDETPGSRRRKRFEQELEAFLQSKRALRAATERYLCKRISPAIEAALAALKRASPFSRRINVKLEHS
jgi:hypothetical protein